MTSIPIFDPTNPPTTLLPPNATPQERALDLSTARLGQVAVGIRTLWDADNCPVALLPWLAWALSVDVWDPAWSEIEKRQAVRDSVSIHRRKGTKGALSTALAPYAAQIIEWFEDSPVGDPYTFVVDVAAESEAQLATIIAIIERVKNARSHYSFRTSVGGGMVYVGCAAVCGDVAIVGI